MPVYCILITGLAISVAPSMVGLLTNRSPLCVCMHSKYTFPLELTTSTNRPFPYIDHFIWVPNDRLYNITITIPLLPKPTTSLNGPFQVDPIVGRFRYVFLFTVKHMYTRYAYMPL